MSGFESLYVSHPGNIATSLLSTDRQPSSPEARFSVRSPSSIYKAKGFGVVITGDGSHALFVIRIRGGGARDYVIPIDFKGRRIRKGLFRYFS